MSSIRRFLLVSLLLSVVIVTISAGGWTYFGIREEIDQILDAELIEANRALQVLFLSDLSNKNLHRIQSALRGFPENTHLPSGLSASKGLADHAHPFMIRRVFQIWNSKGRLMLRSRHAPPFPLSGTRSGFSDTAIGSTSWRVYTFVSKKDGARFQVAQRAHIRDYLTKTIASEHLFHFLLMCPILALLIWGIVGHGLRDLLRITRAVDSRQFDHLKPLRLKAVPIEIMPLVDAINHLMERVNNAFEREKRFTADAAHELRTPLAALRTQTQVATRLTDPKERLDAMHIIVRAVDRCTHVVEQLLTLSRLQPDQPINDPKPTDLSKVTAEVLSDLVSEALAKDIEVELLADETPAVIIGNATSLGILCRNLIDNAIRYTPEGGQVTVVTQVLPDKVLWSVTDSGPGIPPELRERVFDRFFRQLGTKAAGSGLGLSIVSQITNLHHADIALKTAASGQGLCVEVSFNHPTPKSHQFDIQ